MSSSNQVTNQVLRDKYEAIHRQLVETYGEPTWRPHLPPVDELVNTILSQSTSDTNRDYAFAALRERFPDWESVIAAPEEEVREAIRPAGLANQKAPRIQKALREILHHQGELSLEFLREMPLEAAEKWLTDIKGVGPKTAAIVLLFAFGRPAFPVDTHVHRVTRRLGLIGPKVSAEKAHNLLREIGQPETFYAFHLNIIRHGRQVCHARNPKCSVCPLSELCLYFKQEFEA